MNIQTQQLFNEIHTINGRTYTESTLAVQAECCMPVQFACIQSMMTLIVDLAPAKTSSNEVPPANFDNLNTFYGCMHAQGYYDYADINENGRNVNNTVSNICENIVHVQVDSKEYYEYKYGAFSNPELDEKLGRPSTMDEREAEGIRKHNEFLKNANLSLKDRFAANQPGAIAAKKAEEEAAKKAETKVAAKAKASTLKKVVKAVKSVISSISEYDFLLELHEDVLAAKNDVSSTTSINKGEENKTVNTTTQESNTMSNSNGYVQTHKMKSLAEQGYVSTTKSFADLEAAENNTNTNTAEVTPMTTNNTVDNSYDDNELPAAAPVGTMKAKMAAKLAAAKAAAQAEIEVEATPVAKTVEAPVQTTNPITNNTTEESTMKSLSNQGFVSLTAPSVSAPVVAPAPQADAPIVKAELIVNITLSNTNVLSANTIAAMRSKPGAIATTRCAGSIRFNKADDSVYAQFAPLPAKLEDAYGNYNGAVWRLTDSNGVATVLTPEESVAFWASIFSSVGAPGANFFVSTNMPKYTREAVESLIDDTAARAYVISFSDMNNMFDWSHDNYRESTRLTPINASVDFLSNIVEVKMRSSLGAGVTSLQSIRAAAASADNRQTFKAWLRSDNKTAAQKAAQERVAKAAVGATSWSTFETPAQVQAAKAIVVEPTVAEVVVPEVAAVEEVAEEVVVVETTQVVEDDNEGTVSQAVIDMFNMPEIVYNPEDEENQDDFGNIYG